MSANHKLRILPLVLLAVVVLAVPALAEAQRRRGPHRPVVIVGAYSYPRYYYDPWFQWGPYRYPYYRPYLVDDLTSTVRLQVTPREADVFVDGYHAGVVDDFDGVFQRLRLRPGGHEITVFLEGYETARETVYLSPGANRTLQFTMNRLRAGESSEPPPPPTAPEVEESGPGPRPAPRRPQSRPGEEAESGVETQAPARFGTLSLRVQPAEAEILIDGERWGVSDRTERVAIRLSEGRHQVEIRSPGFTTYSEQILIRRGATFTLNVALSR